MAEAEEVRKIAEDEVGELRRDNNLLRARLNLLCGLASKINSSLDPETVLQEIIDSACELTSARYGALGIFDQNGHVTKFITHGVSDDIRERIGDFPTGLGLLGWLQQSQEPLRLSDLGDHPESAGFPANHPSMKSFLGVPIRTSQESLGNLYLTEKSDGQEFSLDDEEILVSFADQAAMAIRNADRYTEEAALRRRVQIEQNRLHAILNSSAAALVVVDANDGRIILANQEVERIFGTTLNQGDGTETYRGQVEYRKPDGSVFPFDELPLQRALKNGETVHGVEVVFALPDGKNIPTLVNAAPVTDDEGVVTAAIAVFDDITTRQEIEQLKSDFLSMISHDLRGPLSAIKGLSSSVLLDSGPRDVDTLMEYISSIDEEVDRMNELVSNLLDMSRIESNRMPKDPEVCHLTDIVSESVRALERSRLGGQHSVTVDVPIELPEIFADYDQISRVLFNLLGNAAKYSPEGSQIRVRSHISPIDENIILTEVSDHGFGIPSEDIGKIFDKFYRVTSHTGRGRPGSGLGLAICRAIVEAHDGKIWVETEPGKGSTFYFELPTQA